MNHRSIAVLALAACATFAHGATTYAVTTLPGSLAQTYTQVYGLSPTTGAIAGAVEPSGQTQLHAALVEGPTLVRLESPGTGDTLAQAVNDSNLAVGTAWSIDYSTSTALSWTTNGRSHPLVAVTAGDSTQAYGISAVGDVAGQERRASDNVDLPVLWHRQVPRLLPMPAGQVGAWARAVSANGTIAGNSYDSADNQHAALWTKGSAALVGPNQSVTMGVNDLGQVVGEYYPVSGVTQPFVATVAGSTTLPTLPGHADGSARAVNSQGIVVGVSSVGQRTVGVAVRWVNGQVEDLNTLLDASSRAAGWVLSSARAIDDAGRILALGQQNGGPRVSLLLVPSGN